MSDAWLDWAPPLRAAATALLALALDEDLGEGDLTARHFAGAPGRRRGRLVAREAGVLAGMPLFFKTFQAVGERMAGRGPDAGSGLAAGGHLEILWSVADGESVGPGQDLATVQAEQAVLHGGERTALNFLQRLSGVATRTARAVALSSGPQVMDTRKTTPGFRLLEKYAVRAGGGLNHRLGLFDAVLVKDNHKAALGGMAAVLERAMALPPELTLIVEVDSPAELEMLLAHPAARRIQRVLLDNFAPEQVARACARRKARGGGPAFEISGGLAAEDLADPRYAEVEAASLGELTHRVRALDLSFEVVPLSAGARLPAQEARWSARLRGALGRPLYCHEALESCLDSLAVLAEAGAPAGTCVTAERQRAGRGRLGRVWESPPGASLLLALLLRPAGDGARIPLISLAAAAALAQAGRAMGAALAVKWPNDVLGAAGGKLAGILPEARVEGGSCRHLLLGVGVNVHQGFGEGAAPLFPGAESLDLAAGRRLSRGALLADFLAALAPWLAALEAGESAALLAAWREFWPHRGRLAADETGAIWRLEDIEPDGRLRVLGPDGPRCLASGSLTLLPAAPLSPPSPASSGGA